jgi:hypothetical protein
MDEINDFLLDIFYFFMYIEDTIGSLYLHFAPTFFFSNSHNMCMKRRNLQEENDGVLSIHFNMRINSQNIGKLLHII